MTKLEKITHFFLIAVCIVSLGLLVKNGFLRAAGTTEPSEKA
jgi:hypothetical protein